MADASAKLAVEAVADHVAALSPTPLRRTVSGSNKIEVFAHSVDEASAAEVYSVVRGYGGERPYNPPPMLQVQIMTVAKLDGDALARAQQLFDRLIDAERPVRNVTVSQIVLSFNNLRPPALLGRRPEGKGEAVFNFDVYYRPA